MINKTEMDKLFLEQYNEQIYRNYYTDKFNYDKSLLFAKKSNVIINLDIKNAYYSLDITKAENFILKTLNKHILSS